MTEPPGAGDANQPQDPPTPPPAENSAPGASPGEPPSPGPQAGYAPPGAGYAPPPAYGQPGYGQPGYGQPAYLGQQAPQPLSPADERLWGMLSHLSPLVGLVIGFTFLGPLLVYLLFKDRSAFVRRHSAESLNFQLSLWVYGAVATLIMFLTLFIAAFVIVPVALIVLVGVVVLQILAAVAANNGQEYRYPLTIRFVK